MPHSLMALVVFAPPPNFKISRYATSDELLPAYRR